MNGRTYMKLKRDVERVLRGEWLTSDRLSDHVDRLWERISALPFPVTEDPSNSFISEAEWDSQFDETIEQFPREMRDWYDDVVELEHVMGQIENHQSVGVPARDMIADITEEANQ